MILAKNVWENFTNKLPGKLLLTSGNFLLTSGKSLLMSGKPHVLGKSYRSCHTSSLPVFMVKVNFETFSYTIQNVYYKLKADMCFQVNNIVTKPIMFPSEL